MAAPHFKTIIAQLNDAGPDAAYMRQLSGVLGSMASKVEGPRSHPTLGYTPMSSVVSERQSYGPLRLSAANDGYQRVGQRSLGSDVADTVRTLLAQVSYDSPMPANDMGYMSNVVGYR